MSTAVNLLQRGTRAAQPAATAVVVGALYCVTDEGDIVEQSDGAAWQSYSPGAGSGDALTTDPLSQFAATTSAQLAGVISDETGSGALVFGTAPTLSNPIVGTQTAGDNSTKAASTAYVDAAVAAGGGGGSSFELFSDVAKSANYTIVSGDKGTTFICSAGLTLTLPAAADKFWFAVYNSSSAGYVTVGTLITLLPGEWCRVGSDGTSFFVLDANLAVAIGSPDRPRAVPNAADDEFIEAALDTGGTRFSGATAWAWTNQGGASTTCGSRRLVITDPANASTNVRAVEQALPGSGPWTYVTKLWVQGLYSSFMFGGMWMRESATGKLETMELRDASGIPTLQNGKWNSVTSFSAAYAAPPVDFYGPIYLKAAFDGTNLIHSFSLDGVSFVVLSSHVPTTWFTTAPDRVGLIIASNTSSAIVNGVHQFFRRTV